MQSPSGCGTQPRPRVARECDAARLGDGQIPASRRHGRRHRPCIRWGNVDRSILLSSAVFEPDDNRAYRLKPGVRSVWVIGLSFRDSPGDVSDSRHARGSRAGGYRRRRSRARVGADDELLGLPRTRARRDCAGSSPRSGRLDDARVARGRCRYAAGQAGGCICPWLSKPGSRCLTPATSVIPSNNTSKRSGTSATDSARTSSIVSIYHNDFGDMNNPANWPKANTGSTGFVGALHAPRLAVSSFLRPTNLRSSGPETSSRFQSRAQPHDQISAHAKYVDTTVAFTELLLRLKNDAARSGEPVCETRSTTCT